MCRHFAYLAGPARLRHWSSTRRTACSSSPTHHASSARQRQRRRVRVGWYHPMSARTGPLSARAADLDRRLVRVARRRVSGLRAGRRPLATPRRSRATRQGRHPSRPAGGCSATTAPCPVGRRRPTNWPRTCRCPDCSPRARPPTPPCSGRCCGTVWRPAPTRYGRSRPHSAWSVGPD